MPRDRSGNRKKTYALNLLAQAIGNAATMGKPFPRICDEARLALAEMHYTSGVLEELIDRLHRRWIGRRARDASCSSAQRSLQFRPTLPACCCRRPLKRPV
jgi:hypothetical protein